MIPYIILVISVALCVIIQENTHKTVMQYSSIKISVSVGLLYILFILFYSLRYNVGMDYGAYYIMTTTADGYMMPLIRGEWLSALFIWIAYILDCPFLYFSSVAAISFFLIMYSLNKYVEVKNGLGWGMLSFMVMPIGFTASLSMMRQFIAIAIIIFCIRYIIHRSLLKFLIGVFIASGFHMASIVAIFMYIVTAKTFKFKYFAIIFILLTLMFLVFNEYVGMIFPGFAQYLNTSYTEDNGGLSIGSIFQLLLYIFFALLFLSLRSYLRGYNNFNIFLRCFVLGCICSGAMFMVEPYNAFRFGGAMLYCWMFIMPYFFHIFNEKSRFALKISMWCLLTLLVCYNLISMEMKGHLREYQTFLNL